MLKAESVRFSAVTPCPARAEESTSDLFIMIYLFAKLSKLKCVCAEQDSFRTELPLGRKSDVVEDGQVKTCLHTKPHRPFDCKREHSIRGSYTYQPWDLDLSEAHM